MYCTRCGTQVPETAAFCPKCGAPVADDAATVVIRPADQPTRPARAAAPGAVPHIQRPTVITLLAVMQFIGAGFWLLAISFGMLGSFAAGGDQGAMALASALFVGVAALQFMCGLGLWNLKAYGRILQLVFAWIFVVAFPVGTIISVLILIYLFKPGVKLLFSGRSAQEMTPEEAAQLSAVTQASSMATVIVVVAVVVGLGLVTAVAAAIAIPALRGARTSANEAAAISVLRTINSAQVEFAATCGKGLYATSLASLGAPQPGSQVGLLNSELASDPAIRNGYIVQLVGQPAERGAVDCNGMPVTTDYFVSAEPITPGETGVRHFGTNASMTIYQSPSPVDRVFTGLPSNAVPIQ